MSSPRNLLLTRLQRDLVGPDAEHEELYDKPSDRYLTGILFPQRLELGAEEDEDMALAGGDSDEDAPPEEPPSTALQKPPAAGLSFACAAEREGDSASLRITIRGGRYSRRENSPAHTGIDEDASASTRGDANSSAEGSPEANSAPAERKRRYKWVRSPVSVTKEVDIPVDHLDEIKDLDGLPKFRLYLTSTRIEGGQIVTVVLVNDNIASHEAGTPRPDELSLFQVEVSIECGQNTRFISKPIVAAASDDDSRTSALLYRNAREFAVGHTCSATWDSEGDGAPTRISTTWLPTQDVKLVSPDGGEELQTAIDREAADPLTASILISAGTEVADRLEWLPRAYGAWIRKQQKRLENPADVIPSLRPQGEKHLKLCAMANERIASGINLLRTDPDVRAAFRLMLRAMEIQRRWSEQGGDPFRWRPFQLAFILYSLESLAKNESDHRDTVDLLWFPTGGGKTEAYLGLIAFNLFLRRIRRREEKDGGSGVSCFMRYTLRLLTLQQFERASTLTLACEFVRRGFEVPEGTPDLRSTAPVSVGLWVGSNSTPNSFKDAVDSLVGSGDVASPKQLTACPCCRSPLDWKPDLKREMIDVSCSGRTCELALAVPLFPVLTVDELIYRDPPTLLFGTIDKYAQIVRNAGAASLFNAPDLPPPELIIQDELHLISGPLGTIAAVYETAIDLASSRGGPRPKVVGSTATIRRADDQILALFDRPSMQFPPPGLDADDSCFAVLPKIPKTRRYVGVTTAGRSAKFTLQAVFASLLQASTAIEDEAAADGYHTLVGYFNALRELGGAVVLTQDDVVRSLRLLGKRWKEGMRDTRALVELTSRVSQAEIRLLLDRLAKKRGEDGAVDVVLATNMISVGVDVSRLSLMVVMGQPKTIAEYIQATSRVGRSINEGLVVAVLNSAKVRDRSHYETFRSWHQTIYRGVEATSVTPFASRSRDRALHGALVGAARLLIPDLRQDPSGIEAQSDSVEDFIDAIVERARRIDGAEAQEVERELKGILRAWKLRAPSIGKYWDDWSPGTSLLMSAEEARGGFGPRSTARAWPTLNSMRNVESGTPFQLEEAT